MVQSTAGDTIAINEIDRQKSRGNGAPEIEIPHIRAGAKETTVCSLRSK